MSGEVVVLPEMLEAGMLILAEREKEKKAPYETVIAVYLAMRAIEEILVMRTGSKSVH